VISKTQNKILDAAEAIALRDGVAHLTLDAVGVEAGLSKGGVLYNFATKDALVRGMVARMIAQCEGEMMRLAELDPAPRGRWVRAYLGVTFPEHGTPSARIKQLAAVLLTAILTNPECLVPVREHFAEHQERLLSDGLPEATVHIIRLAADGLWLSEMLRMPGPADEPRQRMIQQLFDMTRR
jgi:AcrR family transcriptional regulator